MEIWKRNLYVCWLGSFLTSSALSQVAPILPIYIRELGVTDVSSAAMWVGFAFGSTTLMMTFFSPIWGKLADEYGRKPMLLRASLGMAVVLALTAFVVPCQPTARHWTRSYPCSSPSGTRGPASP